MSAGPPDVTALEIPAAEAALTAAGWTISAVIQTRPPKAGGGLGNARVVRQRITGEREIQLVVAYTQYERDAAGRNLRH